MRSTPHYRREVFVEAFKRLGFITGFDTAFERIGSMRANPNIQKPNENDVLLIWNRYGAGEKAAKHFEAHGARVLLAENGYLDMRGTKKSFALALNFHNGAGRYPIPDHSRADQIAIELQPWRGDRGDILLLPQRGIGNKGVAMPRSWEADVKLRIGRKQSVRVRRHPGTSKTGPTLEQDLASARCAVTWGSGAALKAVCFGVPVFYEFPRWIGADGAKFSVNDLKHPARPDRWKMLERIAWAQWKVEEVATGEPFKRLLEMT